MAVDPDKPFNREEMYLAKAAGEGTTVPDEPWSRKEAYLEKIGGRIDEAEEDISELDEKVAALATDISLKGSVADEEHLPSDAAIGDAYITEDTGILYVWVGDKWTPLNMEGGSATVFYFDIGQGDAGFVKNTTVSLYKDFELTEPATGPDVFAAAEAGVALFIAEWVDVIDEEVYERYHWATYIPHFVADDGMDGRGESAFLAISDTSKTAEWAWSSNTWRVMNVYDVPTVVQTRGTSTTNVMSQDATTKMVYTTNGGIAIGDSAPNLFTGSVYIGSQGISSLPQYSVYIGRGNGSYQLGQSSTSVGGLYSRATGSYASSFGSGSVASGEMAMAAGTYASAAQKGSVALGTYSNATTVGEMNIGSTNTAYGYNSTNYRLLSGVHDPVNAHDAATKGYVDTHLGGLTFVALTQTEYDNLSTKDPDTLYIIKAA